MTWTHTLSTDIRLRKLLSVAQLLKLEVERAWTHTLSTDIRLRELLSVAQLLKQGSDRAWTHIPSTDIRLRELLSVAQRLILKVVWGGNFITKYNELLQKYRLSKISRFSTVGFLGQD